jgi:hypothetical protein
MKALYHPLLIHYIFLICSNFEYFNKINDLIFSPTWFVTSQPVEKFVKPHHTPVFEEEKLNNLNSGQTLEFLNEKNSFRNSQKNSSNILENKSLWPLSFEDIYEYPNEKLFQTLIESENKIRNLTLYMVVLDGGSTKTSGDLWSTSVIQKAGQVPLVSWRCMKTVKVTNFLK